MNGGVISGIDRALPNDLGSIISGVLQTGALIRQGNFSSPLLNGESETIGVNTGVEISSTWAGRRSAPIDSLPELRAGQVVRLP